MSPRPAWAVAASLAAAASLANAGCAGYTDVYRQPLTSASRPPTSQLPQVFMRGQQPPSRPFVELALLHARSNESLPEAVAELQQEAQRIGADALVDVRGDSGAYEMSVIGTAILWVHPDPAAAP